MTKISAIRAREILDSRGYPTVAVEVHTTSGIVGEASVPSGASTGSREAVEIRDGDMHRYGGRGVKKAVHHVMGSLNRCLVGKSVLDQGEIDRTMIEKDGTPNKSSIGANAVLGVSLAVARAAALSQGVPLYRYIAGAQVPKLPIPMINILNGGKHAGNDLDFQEFMIRPIRASSFSEAIQRSCEVFHTLKKLLEEKNLVASVGDEGGFAPNLPSNEAALDLLMEAVEKAKYVPGRDFTFAIDCAASEFYDAKRKLYVEEKRKKRKEPFAERSTREQIAYLQGLCQKYPIDSLEDGLSEDDWSGWKDLTETLGPSVQIVGDDIFVTNTKYLKKGIAEKAGNAVLIKLNQVGTLTETLETIELAKTHDYQTVISHRSGETEDAFIADLSAGVKSGQIKTGSVCRSERTVKYNRLFFIEEGLGENASFYGKFSKE